MWEGDGVVLGNFSDRNWENNYIKVIFPFLHCGEFSFMRGRF